MKYIDVTRTTCTSLHLLLEKNVEDYWNVDGEKELSDAWTGFTRFILLNERPPEEYTWSGRGRLTRKQTTSRPNDIWPDMEIDVRRETKTRKRQTIERNILHWAKRRRIQALQWKPLVESWKFRCSSNALQNTDEEQWCNPTQYRETQDKIRLCCWCRRKHETKARRSRTQTSSRSHHCKRGWIL